MANLNGQNIGTNYKGFLNLDSTINTPLDATLRAVTDGMGNSSLLKLSTAALTMGSGTITSNGLLTVKGSGSNILSLRDSSNVEQSYISNSGAAYFNRVNLGSGAIVCSYINNGDDSVSVFSFSYTTGATTFGGSIFRLSGTTSSFPAIKRNGAAIDFRLADDSGYCTVNANQLGIGTNTPDSKIQVVTTGSTSFRIDFGNTGNGDNYIDSGSASSGTTHIRSKVNIVGVVKIGIDSTPNASSMLDIESTTKGFLMPRMTTAQINAIATPANGLQVYNTDLGQPCFYDGAAWRKVSHTNM